MNFNFEGGNVRLATLEPLFSGQLVEALHAEYGRAEHKRAAVGVVADVA